MSLSFTELLKHMNLNYDFGALVLLGKHDAEEWVFEPQACRLARAFHGSTSEAGQWQAQYEAFSILLFKDSGFGEIILSMWESKFP